MRKRLALMRVLVLAACALGGAQAADLPLGAPRPSVAQIVEKNAAARGGVEAWQQVKAMAWSGRIESSNAVRPTLPFVLEQKRPNKTRFEITVDQQKSVRVFDGEQGWKLRPTASGRPELVAYSAEETRFAREAQVIDGPLMDSAARGHALTLEGLDDVDGRSAYRLLARLPGGLAQTIWVDAESFLDLRLDRVSHDAAGRPMTVSLYFRNYKAVERLQMPLVVETRGADATRTNRIVIERVALNPSLEDRLFAQPKPPGASRRGVIVDTRVPPDAAPPRASP